MEFVFVACKSVVHHVHRPVMLCYVSLCEGLCAGAGSLSYIVHVDCCLLRFVNDCNKDDYYYYYYYT